MVLIQGAAQVILIVLLSIKSIKVQEKKKVKSTRLLSLSRNDNLRSQGLDLLWCYWL